jgi:hypothetical protein
METTRLALLVRAKPVAKPTQVSKAKLSAKAKARHVLFELTHVFFVNFIGAMRRILPLGIMQSSETVV